MLHTKTIFAAIIICLSLSAQAQRTELFLLAGMSGSIMSQNGNKEPFSRLYHGHGGVLFGIGSENVMFETGVLYSFRGTEFDQPVIGPSAPGMLDSSYSKLNMNFLDIPAMIVVSPSNFRFFFGPQISLMTTASHGDTKLTSAEVDNLYEKTSFGLRYGMGYISNSNIVLQFHVVSGLSDINKNPNIKWKNSAYQLAIGYRIFSNFLPTLKKSKKETDSVIPEHRKID